MPTLLYHLFPKLTTPERDIRAQNHDIICNTIPENFLSQSHALFCSDMEIGGDRTYVLEGTDLGL